MWFKCLVLTLCFATAIIKSAISVRCDVKTQLDSGWVCGLIRRVELSDGGEFQYASFRGIPYAQQPLGELRFQELQPIKWNYLLAATKEGPVCHQEDDIYGRLVNQEREMNEACIYANVHVPLTKNTGYNAYENRGGYPIFVMIHGGGFYCGSGDTDLHGPEYLVSRGFVVITFNYRLNVFGFLSLNTAKIPGNAGIRDQLTLLRWVQRNARAFGGNAQDVTLAGQSAGAITAHLLALSKETEGLFQRLILMSGTAITAPYSTSPDNAKKSATDFLQILGINDTDPDVIHDQLIKIPIDQIVKANKEFQENSGKWSAVVETEFPGVTRIIDDDPISLICRGRDRQYPIIIGFTNHECRVFEPRDKKADMLEKVKENPLIVLPERIPSSTPEDVALRLANMVIDKYFDGELNYDNYYRLCSDVRFKHPAFQLVRWRGEINTAPSYLYQFSYENEYSVLKAALDIEYNGSAHIEDLTYIFHENEILGEGKAFRPGYRDDAMKNWMTQFVVNFMWCNNPACGYGWSPARPVTLNYQLVYEPYRFHERGPTAEESDVISFLDMIDQQARDYSN